MAQDTEPYAETPLERLEQLVEKHKDAHTEIPVPENLMGQVLGALRETTEQLQSIQRQYLLCEKMAALGHLMAGIAHEISTPIASINSNVNLFARSLDKIMLSAESLPEDLRAKRQITQVVNILKKLNQSNQTACDRVVQMVQSLRSFTRVDVAELRNVDIHEELENALILVHHELKRRIQVIRKYGDMPECACYPSRLNGVFVNMLMNATQAIEGEGQITIETLRDGNDIKIKFTDTGKGIPPENLGRLFEEGFTTKPEGTGLGLAICKRRIEEHHGKIEVESQVGKGTTFTITLPFKQKASDDRPQNG